jgi:two-component system response regulator HydG
MGSMYALLMKSTAGPKRQWALTERRLVIGRGRDCDLIVFDPLVSRRHCELWVAEGALLFQDLGSANTTQVNGCERHGGALGVGDEIKIGDHTFLVGEVDEDARDIAHYDDGTTPKTISAEDTPYYAPKAKSDAGVVGIESFKSLVQCARKFSKAKSSSELCAMLHQIVESETASVASWIVLFHGEDGEIAIRAEGGTTDLALPAETFAQVRRQQRGVLIPTQMRNGSQAMLMTAPMRLDGSVFGGVAAVIPSKDGGSGRDSSFHYFVALVHAFAPFYRALERSEQAARDMDRWTGATDISSALVGRSEAMRLLRDRLERVAASNLNLLVLGETGTGKELVSRLIHNMSSRADRPYVVVNCPAIPRDLFESMIFGHRKGAFTGASESREGYFAEAQGGTIFLDEIGDLPPDFQSRLLRVVESGTYRPIGATRDVTADVRILAATNRPAGGREGTGAIRHDLYHRLAGYEIQLPPLRQRNEDIPDLAGYFLNELLSAGRTRARKFSTGALRRLGQWDWPGNVRELKLCVERAAVLAASDTIPESDVMFWGGNPPEGDCPPANASLEDIERWHLARAFRHFDQNISATAQALGISRSAYDKLRQFGIKE